MEKTECRGVVVLIVWTDNIKDFISRHSILVSPFDPVGYSQLKVEFSVECRLFSIDYTEKLPYPSLFNTNYCNRLDFKMYSVTEIVFQLFIFHFGFSGMAHLIFKLL